MTNPVQKITLSKSRDIPFNKLILSQSNVRRTKTGISLEELAEDIARRTLLQSLNVRPVLDAKGNETGMFEVPAGGRRYRALEMLVKQKRLAKTALVPCVVRAADSPARIVLRPGAVNSHGGCLLPDSPPGGAGFGRLLASRTVLRQTISRMPTRAHGIQPCVRTGGRKQAEFMEAREQPFLRHTSCHLSSSRRLGSPILVCRTIGR